MPVLPLIDALILMGWTALLCGFVIKALWISTSYRPLIFGMSALDCLIVAGICLLFALTLAARSWVKLNEPKLLALRGRGPEARRERQGVRGYDDERSAHYAGESLLSEDEVEVSSADRRRGAAVGR